MLSPYNCRCSGLPLLQLLLVCYLCQLITAQQLTWLDTGQFWCLHGCVWFSKFWILWASRIKRSLHGFLSSEHSRTQVKAKASQKIGAGRLWVGAGVILIFKFMSMKCTHLPAPSKIHLGKFDEKVPYDSQCPLFRLCSIILYTQCFLEVSLGAFYLKLFLTGCYSWQQIPFLCPHELTSMSHMLERLRNNRNKWAGVSVGSFLQLLSSWTFRTGSLFLRAHRALWVTPKGFKVCGQQYSLSRLLRWQEWLYNSGSLLTNWAPFISPTSSQAVEHTVTVTGRKISV